MANDKSKKGKRSSSSRSSTSSRLSTVEIQNITDRLKHQQYCDSTKRNFYTVWKIFADFLIRLDHQPQDWEERIILFVGHLINSKKQSSTVKSYVSAIKAVLREDNVKFEEDTYLLNSLTRACRLQNDQIKTRLAIKKGLLSIILNQLTEIYSTQPYLCLLYWALFSTMYYGLLRISEVSQGLRAVKAKDVQIGYNKKNSCWCCTHPRRIGKTWSHNWSRFQLRHAWNPIKVIEETAHSHVYITCYGNMLRPEVVTSLLMNHSLCSRTKVQFPRDRLLSYWKQQ